MTQSNTQAPTNPEGRNRDPIRTIAHVEHLERDNPGDMVMGYMDGFKNNPWPDREPSPAYEHGRRNGVSDRTGSSDADQQSVARDFVARSRARQPETNHDH